MRTIRKIYNAPAKHWVGNGFYVSPLFSHMGEDKQTSPFLMFDYAMPHTFAPNNGAPRGVGAHPHSGFETVTIAYQGEVAHRDSTGSGGVIGEGDVQWMTAGAGIVHEEFHAESFGKRGGEFEMAQLWVNLPAKDKKTPARYTNTWPKTTSPWCRWPMMPAMPALSPAASATPMAQPKPSPSLMCGISCSTAVRAPIWMCRPATT